MNISFHGAAQTVTGSKHIVTTDKGTSFLLDCGMFQGMGRETPALNSHLPQGITAVDFVILSHAHIDHSGLLPLLVKEGYQGKIYCTQATIDLVKLLLEDSANIQENDVKFQNKQRIQAGKEPLQPLYTKQDAYNVFSLLEGVPYGKWVRIHKDVELLFTDAGHIIGSACVHVRVQETKGIKQLTFSGDIGRYRDTLLKSPEIFPQADVIICESTYGNELHEPVFSTADVLLQHITETCLEKKGKLIIPAFSVGRTQEILYHLNQLELENRLPQLDYFVDSPLSNKATLVVKSHAELFNKRVQKILASDSDPFDFKGLTYVSSAEESKLLNYRKEPCVIISSSGMAEAGRVKHHISNTIENSRNTILITGYCEPNSLGGRLMKQPKEVTIFGLPHEVHASIAILKSMSAHGDYEDICQWLACQNPALVSDVFLVHGDYNEQYALSRKLERKGFKTVHIPRLHESFEL
jgi:metallo-beta-lactamase family protein